MEISGWDFNRIFYINENSNLLYNLEKSTFKLLKWNLNELSRKIFTFIKFQFPASLKCNQISLTQSQKHFNVEMQLLWVSWTPLGCPVDPDVYIMIATSFFDGATGSILLLMPFSMTSLYEIVWILSNPCVSVLWSWSSK